MELSIIIINKDTPKLTKNAIFSAFKTIKELEFEVIVVDNSDKKENVLNLDKENLQNVKIIKGIKNKGFSNACNIGAEKACGELLLFLNSDTVLFDYTVDCAVKFFRKSYDIGALGVRQLLKNGKLDAGCKRGFPTPMSSLYYFLGLSKIFPKSKVFGAYQQTFIDERDVVEVDCISGAFMLMRKDVFNRVNGFDEDYFLYGEDVDLCYRLKQAGFKNIYYGRVSFLHIKKQSSKQDLKALESFYKSMWIFYSKHYKKKYCFFVGWLVKLGIFLKLWVAKRKFNRNLV